MESQSETTQTVSALKLPVLKTGDYDLWSMRMEQYLTHTDYALWGPSVLADAIAGSFSADTVWVVSDCDSIFSLIMRSCVDIVFFLFRVSQQALIPLVDPFLTDLT
ncbi:hypothetical protein Tco_0037891 [Tanacetum coccineum]